MLSISPNSRFSYLPFCVCAALLGGLVTGLCGAGGGIVLVFALNRLARGGILDRRDVFATALCVTLPIALAAGVSYLTSGTLQARALPPLLLPALLGGVCGAWLLDRINPTLLRLLFALLILRSGFRLLQA